MKDKQGILLDLIEAIMIIGAMTFATMFILVIWVLAIILKSIQALYRALVFVVRGSWRWIKSPLSS